MATIEKPKKEKNKKTKAREKEKVQLGGHIEEEDNRTLNELKQLKARVDATSDKSEIISQERLDIFEQENIEASSTVLENSKKMADKMSIAEGNMPLACAAITTISNDNIQTPSAPPCADTQELNVAPIKFKTENTKIIQYPHLASLQHMEEKANVIYQKNIKSPGFCLIGSQLKPFTDEQLKQIYNCEELDLVKHFELEFLMNSLLESHETDPLYTALLEYYNLQSKLNVNLYDINDYRKTILRIREKIWKFVPITQTFFGRCMDGNTVKETVTYNIAQVDDEVISICGEKLKNLFDLLSNSYTLNFINANITKMRINSMINELTSFPPVVDKLQAPMEPKLHRYIDEGALQCMTNLRRAIAILFSFTRQISPNEIFDTDLKQWLQSLVSLHLLIATREDHWFLLFNILRCPSGISSWATEFMQIPIPKAISTTNGMQVNEVSLDLFSPEISHCVSVLQILLLPIQKRDEYLKRFKQEITDPVKDDLWILVDSDGEDSTNSSVACLGLRENDLIALLNQIPFEDIFLSAMNIEKFLNDYIIQEDCISVNQMLRVIAFFARLIDILGNGMLTYNAERYKQLAKRLGRLIRHTLQYISDYYELFRNNNVPKDITACERIGVELNALLFRACKFIYQTRNLATWQYYSSLPYSSLDAQTIIQFFYYLNVGFPAELDPTLSSNTVDKLIWKKLYNFFYNIDYTERLNEPDFWMKFNMANADSSAEDLYYLLQAFFEMANNRDKVKDWELIKIICLHIFTIGFINENTRDICYKTARDMLVNLTLCYEELMSCLLLQLKIRFNDMENSVYLFQSLPLENWKPGMDSFDILSNWLLHYEFQSKENIFARTIISHLNWNFDYDGRLFLPHNIHVRMACLITEALSKNAPETVGVSGITESVRQISSFMDFNQATKDQFINWCWSMIAILRLHLMDQSVEFVKQTLRNPVEHLIFVPELERINLIYQNVTENRPLALYVAILVSLHGHSIPLICQKGFSLIKMLLNDFRHAAVIRCIELIVPLFLETPETLANCEGFQQILNTLLMADETYMKMAKDIICTNSIGPILEMMDNMIHNQLTNYADYGLTTPLNLVNVWLNCLTALPNWQNTNAVYLLDKILCIAYQYPDVRLQATEFFQHHFKDCNDWKGIKTSTLKTIFGTQQSRIPAIKSNNVWLSLIILEIEFNTQEANFWPEFVRQLSVTSVKLNLDNILKKTASIVKITPFPAHMLVIYKYANLLSTMDPSHWLFPTVNQKFFQLYLSRVSYGLDNENLQAVYGVSDKFYDGNVQVMKKIKANLKAAEGIYTQKANKCTGDEIDNTKFFYTNCANLMKTFTLWLEEVSINRQSIDSLNFPPQYNTTKLREILIGNTSPWTEYLFLPIISKNQRNKANQWARQCHRIKSTKYLRSPLPTKTKSTPIERIKTHLSSYDKRCAAPKYIKRETKLKTKIDKQIINEVQKGMKIITKTAQNFNLISSELNFLNKKCMEDVCNLYQMVPFKDVKLKTCNFLISKNTCASPARIEITLERICKRDQIEEELKKNNDRQDKIIDAILHPNTKEFVLAIEQLVEIIKDLIDMNNTNSHISKLTRDIGVNIFYMTVENMNEITMNFIPTRNTLIQFLSELSIFIEADQEQQGLTILDTALKRPDLISQLSGVFMPTRTRSEFFIKMYTFLVDSYLKRSDTKILFVLFSKFNIPIWLETFRPKLFDINRLLHLILRGLECWCQPDSNDLQVLFQRHLVHIFEYDFPEHYGEVMQMILNRISEQKVVPLVLLDLLNSLLKRLSCQEVSQPINNEKLQEISIDFARRQNIFTLEAVTETMMMFARHFQKERLEHGLHGLYPKHKEFCKPISMWFSCFGHMLVASAMCHYQDLLADQISDIIFGSIIDMFAPWLIPYTENTMPQPTAKWIQQFTEKGHTLFPWSEQHANTSKIIIRPFINILIFTLENLPASSKILAHTFGWYVHHFTHPNIGRYIYAPIQDGLVVLPWELFKPNENYINMLHDSLQNYIPDLHAMLGHIFIRINWCTWFAENFVAFPFNVKIPVISQLFAIFIKISFEPNIHIHINTSKILEDAVNYPWHMVDYNELEILMKWFSSTVEPSIILQIPTETNYADRAVLELLRLGCGMMPEHPSFRMITNATAKRILYTRLIVRLLRSCAAKNQQFLATKNGLYIFDNTFFSLLNTINKTVNALAPSKDQAEQNRETVNLLIEIITPMQTQSEEVSNLHIKTLINWQENTIPGNLCLYNILQAIGYMKAFIAGTYTLLESTINYYFRTSTETKDWHNPTWLNILQILRMSLSKLELMPLLQGPYFNTLHIFIIYNYDIIKNTSEKGAFLEHMCQVIQNLKTSPSTESQLATVWGLLISRCSKQMQEFDDIRKSFILLGRHFHELSKQTESWGESILGAMGLKKDIITTRRKVLSSCLACVVFSLFPIKGTEPKANQEFENSLYELTMMIANKKFIDVKPLIVKAISMLKEQEIPNPCDVPHLVWRLIGLFYHDEIMKTLPDVWSFDFELN